MTANIPSVESVHNEIRKAFETVPPPGLADIVCDYWGGRMKDQDSMERARAAFAGKNYADMPLPFMKEWWSSICYLSPEGYRHCLPILLLRCLESYTTDEDMRFTVVQSLVPSAFELYNQGHDPHFEKQTSTFDVAQLSAVASFLGLAFESSEGPKYLASRALRWGWNRVNHPALEAARADFVGLRNYDRPESDDSLVRSLIAQVIHGFSQTPAPDPKDMASGCDDEPYVYALEFRGVSWRKLHPTFLACHYPSLSFMSEAAFRYYLPAYLIADLSGDPSGADPVFHLTYGLTVDEGGTAEFGINWRHYALRQFSPFEKGEREAVIAYLRYRRDHDEVAAERIEEALASYWVPSLTSAA